MDDHLKAAPTLGKMRPLDEILKGVSRSFFLSLRLLPERVRPGVSLAYLIARASDTVADVPGGEDAMAVTMESRLQALDEIENTLTLDSSDPVQMMPRCHDLAERTPHTFEQALLSQMAEVLAQALAMPQRDRDLLIEVCGTIIGGQRLDVQRFGAGPQNLGCLETSEQVQEYTWQVAGCVGLYWTSVCELHLPGWRSCDLAWMAETGVRYGQGLQRLNLLRDTAQDLRNGRCYWPRQELATVELTPKTLRLAVLERNATVLCQMQPLVTRWIEQARLDLSHGLAYALAVKPWRLRVASALPALLGLQTLMDIEAQGPMALGEAVKVPRNRLRSMLWRLLWLSTRPRRMLSWGLSLGADPRALSPVVADERIQA